MGSDQQHDGFAFDVPEEGRSGASGFLVDSMRRRPLGRRLLSVLTVVLFLGGAGMFTYPLFTDVYTEQVIQQRLEDEFVRIEADSFDEWEASVVGQTGKALTMIAIPDIGVETLVVEGTSPAALRAGAGHYPNTPLPGQPGNVAIAGHRTTYGKPFNRLDELPIGAEIWLATPVGDHLYRVTAPPSGGACKQAVEGFGACITHPQDWEIISSAGEGGSGGGAAGAGNGVADGSTLTLTTCHPKGSARERLVIRAELVETRPAGSYQAQR